MSFYAVYTQSQKTNMLQFEISQGRMMKYRSVSCWIEPEAPLPHYTLK